MRKNNNKNGHKHLRSASVSDSNKRVDKPVIMGFFFQAQLKDEGLDFHIGDLKHYFRCCGVDEDAITEFSDALMLRTIHYISKK